MAQKIQLATVLVFALETSFTFYSVQLGWFLTLFQLRNIFFNYQTYTHVLGRNQQLRAKTKWVLLISYLCILVSFPRFLPLRLSSTPLACEGNIQVCILSHDSLASSLLISRLLAVQLES